MHQENTRVIFDKHFETLERFNAVGGDATLFEKEPYVNRNMREQRFDSPKLNSVNVDSGMTPAGYMDTFNCLKDDYHKRYLLERYNETTSKRTK